MTLARITSTFFIGLTLLTTSCTTIKTQFGKTIVENITDTNITKQEILKIKSLNNDVFDSANFTGKDQFEIKYRLFKPAQKQNRTDKYPLVIIFHSSGRPVGTDNKSQLGILPKLFASSDIQKRYPAYILAPQFPTRSSDYIIDSGRNILVSISRICVKAALKLIDSLKENLNIDNNRIYVVGYSMGGSTVINSLSLRPDLFAAGISISGIPQFDKIKDLTSIPIWLIHGIDDTENPIASDEQFYRELNKTNRIRFWELKATTHDNVFTKQILGQTLPEWLFKQRKK